jgi:hypothetical protein
VFGGLWLKLKSNIATAGPEQKRLTAWLFVKKPLFT